MEAAQAYEADWGWEQDERRLVYRLMGEILPADPNPSEPAVAFLDLVHTQMEPSGEAEQDAPIMPAPQLRRLTPDLISEVYNELREISAYLLERDSGKLA